MLISRNVLLGRGDTVANLPARARSALYWMRALGVDPRRGVRNARQLPSFVRDAKQFREMGGTIDQFLPHLGDVDAEAGAGGGHYFWQDLIVAQRVARANPARHVDLGSRIDGFVAHLLVFRDVEVLDVRELHSKIPGLTFVRADGTTLAGVPDRSVESFSSLHALEHFGLGRYGDGLDPRGHIRGMQNAQRVLAPQGSLYISFPVGPERVEFNGQRVIDPELPMRVLGELQLVDFVAIPQVGLPIHGSDPGSFRREGNWCGLYEFTR